MKNIFPINTKVLQEHRKQIVSQNAQLIWFTGLSGSGKSTLAVEVEKQLYAKGVLTYLLDGDNLRSGLNQDLGFSDEDRIENIRRIAEVSKLMLDAGIVVLASFISPFIDERKLVAQKVGLDNFKEIFVNCPLSVCEKRDVKGLYAKARNGEILNFTGISSPYEKPTNPFLEINTDREELSISVDKVIDAIYSFIKI